MPDARTLAALLADPGSVPPAAVPAVLGELEKIKAVLWARLTAPIATPTNMGPLGRAEGEWLTAGEAAAWLGYSQRTVRRWMHDGTWRKGEHWFRQRGTRPRIRRSALAAWLQEQEKPVRAVGLAYGADIPRGRGRRLTSLRNNCKGVVHGANAGAEADGAAGRVPGAKAADTAARGG